jgi:dihydrofolate reductase
MARIALVVAVAKNGVIGRGGKLPWRLRSDMAWFKAITMGKPVIMGRKTWESLPRKPLPGRDNIVVTRQPAYVAEGARVVRDIDAAISAAQELARSSNADEIAVIGGGEIYAQTLPMADRIYLTEVDLEPVGDTCFPALAPSAWREVDRQPKMPGEGDDAAFVLRTLDRRQS